MPRLILASASPRRADLLRQLGVSFEQRGANIDETQYSGEPAEDYVVRLAQEKSAALHSGADELAVLAADTCVVLDEQLLGKPRDHFDGLAMLARLSGREHRVLTAVCLRWGSHVAETLSDTRVQFANLDREQCEAYLATDEPWDKAGAYGIQGIAGAFVETLTGSYSGVVGLPLAETWALLQRFGVGTLLENGTS